MEEVGFCVEITCLEFADDTSGLIVAKDEFVTHTEKVCQKLQFKLANINRVRPYLSQERAKLITDSLVLSTISYMVIIYLCLHLNHLSSWQQKPSTTTNSMASGLVMKTALGL